MCETPALLRKTPGFQENKSRILYGKLMESQFERWLFYVRVVKKVYKNLYLQ